MGHFNFCVFVLFFASHVLAQSHPVSHKTNTTGIHVEVYAAKAASVNSFIFFDSVGSLIVDTTRSSKEALEVAKLARAHGLGPNIIFVTHGHPDHYLGMGALRKEFPDAQIFVAIPQVKEDIIRFAQVADQNHWLEDEPLMKPKSDKNPMGFDYQNEIHILTGNTLVLPGGEKLEVLSDFPRTEAEHETLLYSKKMNSLFASDLVYSGVHLWLAGGVDLNAIRNWQTSLKKLSEQYTLLNVTVYPGHGEQTDSSIFDTDLNYIKNILTVVESAKSQQEAKTKMMEKYPTWENTDFILVQSIKNLFKLLKK